MLPSIPGPSADHPAIPDQRYEWAHCRDCGARIGWTDATCPSCGEAQRSVESDRSPRVAAALSAVVPGAGQSYVDERRRGLLSIAAFVLVFGVVVVSAVEDGRPIGPGMFLDQGPAIGPFGPLALLLTHGR